MGHSQGPVLQCGVVWWNHHVRRHRRTHDQRTDSPRAFYHENQSRGSSRAQVLSLDRRVDPFFPVDFPANVDLEGGVRRVWSDNRAPQVLLMYLWLTTRRIDLRTSHVSNGSFQCSRLRREYILNLFSFSFCRFCARDVLSRIILQTILNSGETSSSNMAMASPK